MICGTLVKTDRGLMQVESVCSGYKIWTRHGWKTIAEKVELGPQYPLELKTDLGYSIFSTTQQTFEVLLPTGCTEMRTADTLKGEYLLQDFGTRPFPEVAPCVHLNNDTLKMTVPLSYLIGVLAKNPSENRLSSGIRQQLLTCFGEGFSESDWFRKINPGRNLGLILRSPRVHARSFLRGIFDAEGCIHDSQVCLYAGVFSIALRMSVLFLLLDLGIDCRISEGHERHIAIASGSRKRFADLIGFSEPSLQQKIGEGVPDRRWALGHLFAKICHTYRDRIGSSPFERRILYGDTVMVPTSTFDTMLGLLRDVADDLDVLTLRSLLDSTIATEVNTVALCRTTMPAYRLDYV